MDVRKAISLFTLYIIILAIIQGITEFLPISSSGHLVIIPELLCWPSHSLTVDVAVHVGSLMAVMIYFWRDLFTMFSSFYQWTKGNKTPYGNLAGHLVIASIPIMIAGFIVNKYLVSDLRSFQIIGWATILFGILLYLVDKISVTVRQIKHLDWIDALIIGIVQTFALIPGASRTGVTITAARLLGLEREESTRFSMLLAIPAIIGAGSLKSYELYMFGSPEETKIALTAAGTSFVVALACIHLLMMWVRTSSFTPFVLYRLVLGAFLLLLAYGYVDTNFCHIFSIPSGTSFLAQSGS